MIFTTLLLGVSSGYAGLALGIARWRADTGRSEQADARSGHLAQTWILGRGLLEAIALHAAYRVLLYLDQARLAGLVVVLAALYLFSRFAMESTARSFVRVTRGGQRRTEDSHEA